MRIPLESLSGRLGGNIGQGIASGFQHLGNQQVQKESDIKLQNTLRALGLKPEAAGLPADIRGPYVKQALQEPSNQAYATALSELLGGQYQGESQGQQEMGGQQIRPQLSAQQATKLAELGLKKEEIESKRGKEVREFNKPFIEKRNAAEKNIADYKKLIQLAEKGNIRAGNKHALLNKLGLQEFNQNIDTQNVQKLTARLAQNIGSIFGGRVTNFLEQTFQKSLPSLWNTPQGIVTVSKLNMYADEAIVAEDNARSKIIKENRGRIPDNIDEQIRDRVAPLKNELENKAMSVLMSANFPPAKNYSGDTVVEFEGNKFKNDKGEWILIEEGQ